MTEYKEILLKEIVLRWLPLIILAILLSSVLLYFRKLISPYVDVLRWKGWVFIFLFVPLFLSSLWGFYDTAAMRFDYKNNAFISYVGEIKHIPEKGNKSIDVYQLEQIDSVFVEANIGAIDTTIRRCSARVVYASRSKFVVKIEVLEIKETGLPVKIY